MGGEVIDIVINQDTGDETVIQDHIKPRDSKSTLQQGMHFDQ